MRLDSPYDMDSTTLNMSLESTTVTPPNTQLETYQSIILAIFFGIILVLAVFGNALVISVIIRHRGMRTRTNMFLFNLAVADFLVGLIVIPFSFTTIVRGRWIFGEVLCIINGFLNALCLMTSIHTLMYISIHKYLSISRPFSRFLTKRKILVMIAIAWLYPMILSILTVTGLTHVSYKNGTAQCGPVYPSSDKPKTYIHHWLVQVTIILIPLIILGFTYIRMFIEIRKHSKRLQESSTLELDAIISQQKKVTMTLFIVLACFVVCWMPYMIYSQYVSFTTAQQRIPSLNIPAYFFGMLNSACNPIIYALRSPPFREGYLEILCRRHAVVMSDETIDERQTPTLTSRVTHLWGVLKTTVRFMKPTPPPQPQGRARGWSAISIAALNNHTVNTPTVTPANKSMTQLMKEIPRNRGHSVITKDGATVVMKDGKIVCVREKRSDTSDGIRSSPGVRTSAVLRNSPTLHENEVLRNSPVCRDSLVLQENPISRDSPISDRYDDNHIEGLVDVVRNGGVGDGMGSDGHSGGVRDSMGSALDNVFVELPETHDENGVRHAGGIKVDIISYV